METDKLVEELKVLYPCGDRDTLLEVLVACDGSIDQAKVLLGPPERAAGDRPKKRGLEMIQMTSAAVKRPKDSTGGTISLHTVEEIERAIPYVRVFKNFLPEEIAEEMVESLVSKKLLFQDKEFYIAGKLCRSSQKSTMFTTPKYMKMNSLYSSNKKENVEFFPELYKATVFVDAKVNELLGDGRERHRLEIQDKWESGVCVGNYFANNKSHLDWHSDKLTNLGPLPVVTSLSFGATRIFRMRRVEPSTSTIFNLILPNNTLLVMMPGAQELYKHGVPTLKNSLVARHSVTNEGRFSLTFRMVHPLLHDNPIYCDKCHERMILRRLAASGIYMWMCYSSFNGGHCQRRRYAKFDKLNSREPVTAADLVTDVKSEASVWFEDTQARPDKAAEPISSASTFPFSFSTANTYSVEPVPSELAKEKNLQ